MAQFLKDPQSQLDYAIDWRAHYLTDTQIIETDQGWIITPAAETSADLAVVAHTHDQDRTTVQVMGGVPGRVYRLTNRIITNDGQTEERSLWLRVIHR